MGYFYSARGTAATITVLLPGAAREMALSCETFGQNHATGRERDLFATSQFDCLLSAQYDHILAVGGRMPILRLSCR